MDRVFLDANVLFSAAWRPDSRLARLWRLEGVRLLSSQYAVEEARRNLNDRDQRERLSRLAASMEIVATVAAMPAALRLPMKDQPILGAALAARTTHLVTGDVTHFGRLMGRRVEGVLILTPAQYLRSAS